MRFEKINLLTCSLVLTLIAGTAIGQQQQAAHRFRIVNDRTSFTIPFELVDNRIFVSARLNGQGPFSFILDTGGYGAISTYAAHKSGLDLGAEVQGTGAGSNVVTARETAVKDFQLGLLHISDLDLRVFDFSDSRHVFGKRRLDGIIGLPVFERLVVRIDYIRRLITFTQPSSFHYSGHGTTVPFTLERFLPLVQANLDGIAGVFGIDTGDRSTLTLKGPFMEANRLTEKYKPLIEAITGWGIGGSIRTQVVRTQRFSFSGFQIDDPVTRFSLQRAGAFAANDAAGNMGAGVLKQFTVTFDYSRRQIIFEKNSLYGRRDDYDRSGMWISESLDGKNFEITDVVANGPANVAGLKVGDKILSIDGQKTKTLPLLEARIKFKSSAPGHVVRMVVQSDTGQRRVDVILRDLV